jgi:hypothetical protein
MVLFIFELGLVWNWVGSIYSTQQTLNKSNQWNLRIGLWTSMTRLNLVDPSWMNLYLGKNPTYHFPQLALQNPGLTFLPGGPSDPFSQISIQNSCHLLGRNESWSNNVSIAELCGLIEGALLFPSVNYSLKLQISKISRYFEIECAICICIQLLLQFLIHICDFIFLIL